MADLSDIDPNLSAARVVARSMAEAGAKILRDGPPPPVRFAFVFGGATREEVAEQLPANFQVAVPGTLPGGRFTGKEGFLVQGRDAARYTLTDDVLPALAARNISGEEITPAEARLIHITIQERPPQTFSGPVYDRLAALPHESPVDSVLPEIRYASAAEASLVKGHHRHQPAQHKIDGLSLG
jgi:hypothetical protein